MNFELIFLHFSIRNHFTILKFRPISLHLMHLEIIVCLEVISHHPFQVSRFLCSTGIVPVVNELSIQHHLYQGQIGSLLLLLLLLLLII